MGSRVDPWADPYSYRRVDGNEHNAFRRSVLHAAMDMCKGGGALQAPAIPQKGTAYFWRNHHWNGEDDVRSIHAGCGAAASIKTMATVFFRDGPGPFEEQSGFLSPHEAYEDASGETFRQIQLQGIQLFRLRCLQRLYEMQQEGAELQGGPDAREVVRALQEKHWESLLEDGHLDRVETTRR